MEMASESFYHDSGQSAMKNMKAKMTLDFAAPGARKENTLCPPPTNTGVLASPDLKMLKLVSPELERLIISQQNGIITTPTPTQVAYPRSVTEEQEAYAGGFVDALAELHKTKTDGSDLIPSETIMVTSGPPMMPTTVVTDSTGLMQQTAMVDSMETDSGPTYTTLGSVVLPPVAHQSHAATVTTTALPPMSSTIDMMPGSTVAQTLQHHDSRTSSPLVIQPMAGVNRMLIKEEPQTVPCMNSVSPPLINPIDMDAQEGIKCERKRARNRVAARKCRTRKLERISRLEDRVDELKEQNGDLVQTAQTLREQVCQLKKQIMQHVTSGCQVMLSQNVL